MISVAIVADIRLYREGLADVLDRQPEITVVDAAGSDPADIDRVVRAQPNVVVIDMVMPTSASIARGFAKTAPQIKVVALGVPPTVTHVLACAETGVVGCVARDGSLDDLLTAVRRAAQGEAQYSPQIVAVLLHRIAVRTERRQVPATDRLTARELEIVTLLDRGLTNKEIARRLFIEPATVKNHVHHILEKLHISRRTEVAAWVRAHNNAGFIPGEGVDQRV